MITIKHPIEFPNTYPLDRIGPLKDLLFFDIETTGFSGETSQLYLIGCTYFDGFGWKLIQWFADTRQAEKELLDAFFEFLKRLRRHTDSLKKDFSLVGEMLHGDYNQRMNDEMLHSATNYECYKGLYSSFNSMNMFEINHSLLRQFGPENWTLYKGKHLLCFVDNHDVTRVASILTNENHLPLIYALLFGMPGIPCVYYGSEWGAKADKSQGDPALRPSFKEPEFNELSEFISKLADIKKNSKALNYGDFSSTVLTNKQCVFRRSTGDETVYVAINADDQEYTAYFGAEKNQVTDLLSGAIMNLDGGLKMAPYSAYFLA